MTYYTAQTLLAEYKDKKPSVILFDWDNTLVDTWPLIQCALAATFTKWGRTPWTLQECKENVGLSMRDAFPSLFGDEWEVAGKHYIDSYKDIHLEALQPLPGMEQLLKASWSDGVYLGVVSNKTGPVLRKEASKLGWKGYFQTLIGSGDAEKDKPHTAPITLALGEKAGDMSGYWFVGDSDVDRDAAANAGMRYYDVRVA